MPKFRDVEATPEVLIGAVNDHELALGDLKDKIGTMAPIIEQVKDMQGRIDDLFRRPQTDAGNGRTLVIDLPSGVKNGAAFDAFHKAETEVARKGPGRYAEPDRSDLVARFQDECDRLLLLATFAGYVDQKGIPDALRIRQTPYYRGTFLPRLREFRSHVKEAFDTADAGAGDEWVPNEYSTRLWEKVRLELAVAGLYETVTIPRFPFEMPSWLADLTASKFAENTSDTGQTAFADGLGSTTVTGRFQFDGKTLAMKVLWSWEVDEDSIVAMQPFMARAVIFGIRNGLETAIINGDSDGTHMDSDIGASTTHATTAWDGLRKVGLAGTADITAGNAKLNTSANWGTFVDVGARAAMGKYGVIPSNLAFIVGPKVAAQIRQVTEFRTLYAVGAMATAVAGGSGLMPDGIPLIISEFSRENLNASGVFDGVTTDRATLVVTDRRTWMLGVGRQIRTQLLRERYADFGQYAVIASWRGDFKTPLASTENHVGLVYNISVA